jgi:phosphatidate cytidylyltransferase
MLHWRLISGLTFLTVFLCALYLPVLSWVLPLLIVVATVLGTLEYGLLIRVKGFHPTMLVLVICALAILFIARIESMELFPVLAMMAFIIISLLQLLRSGYENYAARIGASIVGCFYVSLPMALLLIIFSQKELAQPAIVFCVGVSWFSDIGAYTVGRLVGRHKLAPKLSPNKTIEGSVGGIFFSLLAALLLCCFWPRMREVFPYGWGLALAVLFAVGGQLGDLVESALKRDAGVKDSGWDWTGHGGMLDIIDSLIFCVPMLFIYLMLKFPGYNWL